MHTHSTFELFKYVVARRLELAPSLVYGCSMRLAEVVARSPVATNSIDLMEAVAGAMAELGIDDRLELPAMTLAHTMDDLMDAIGRQLARADAASAERSPSLS